MDEKRAFQKKENPFGFLSNEYYLFFPVPSQRGHVSDPPKMS